MVAKNFKSDCLGGGVTDVKQWHYREIESQVVAKYYADEFNLSGPPKKCDFIVPYCIEMVQRQGRPLYNVEVLFHGDKYEKHNTNAGGVTSDRNTPQAFSHFTFAASGKQLCVCDIQGVLDMYTDPQVHTADGEGFGQGNLGKDGIHRFLATHRCNEICEYLGLRQPKTEKVEVEVECPADAQPGDWIDWAVEGPDGQCHDWQVPRGAVPGQRYKMLVNVVALEDRAALRPARRG